MPGAFLAAADDQRRAGRDLRQLLHRTPPVPDRRRQDLLPAIRWHSRRNTALAAQAQIVFRSTTLRSMLLEAYGFWWLGQIALIAAIASFIGADLMLILSMFAFVHLRRTAPETEILPRVATWVQVNA
jgi:hypothetical protein